ncbi:hypothetical protein RFI_15987 [Reticulomyxa filosa]|uniref:25S rRNA (uridine-N(3))-methyltransferase BMT5-like domain-containing protein n=1 Tax=Reticulomyxa filosa TaxID=46433 RepID=X6N5K7_RETFI|nr:hypothetical protein RFI_15987 [Reticulomyxa filosa]|eukprot:ETO21218.1 hypothetical protein RFI_15987 [Reticulomyxa filosa]
MLQTVLPLDKSELFESMHQLYHPEQRILVVGEWDFVFSKYLCQSLHNKGHNLVLVSHFADNTMEKSTKLLKTDRDKNIAFLQQNGAIVNCSVHPVDLLRSMQKYDLIKDEKNSGFDIIIWPFPRVSKTLGKFPNVQDILILQSFFQALAQH